MIISVFRKFRKQSIRKQFIIQTIVLSVLLLLVCLFLNASIRKPFIDNNNAYTKETITRFSDEVQSLYQEIDVLCMQMQRNVKYYGILSAKDYREIPYEMVKAVSNDTSSIRWTHNGIQDISLVSDLFGWSIMYPVGDLHGFHEEMQEKTELHSFGIRQASTLIEDKYPPYLVLGYNVKDSSFSHIGSIIISVDIPNTSFSLPSDDDLDTYYLIVDVNGNYLSVNSSEEISKDIMSVWNSEIKQLNPEEMQEGGVYPIKSFAGKYSVQYRFVPELNCFVVSAVNLSQLKQKLNYVTIQTIVMALLCILCLAVLWVVIYGNFIRPFNTLNNTIVNVRKSKTRKLAQPLHLEGCAEIENTSREFSRMLNSIYELNEEIVTTSNHLYETEIQRRVAEVSFLRSQINPHFIYNTLELIRSIALENNEPEIGAATLAMGKIMRYSAKGDDIVPFSQEIEITKAYLNIQQARFKNKLNCIFDFHSETLDLPVIKMLIQPLIENAVSYGIEPQKGAGILMVSSRIADDCLRITVRDDGAGIPEETLKALQTALKRKNYDTSRHVGIINTHARIQLQYGNEYGITLESYPDEGTTVVLTLPATKE